MSRCRLCIPLLLAGLGGLLLLGVFLAAAPSAAAADGAVLLVPDQYDTIQKAIDAAQPGDTIRVRELPSPTEQSLYFEHLSITKAITLSGGWNFSYTEQVPSGTMIDGRKQGRIFSITTALGDQVVIEGFTMVNGNATGLGGTELQAGHDGLFSPGWVTPTVSLQGSAPAGPDTPAALRAELAAQAAAGALPPALGGLPDLLARLDHSDAAAAPYAALADQQAANSVAPDCGGAVYSSGASLRLANNTIADSTASYLHDGYGGAVCIVSAPDGEVQIDKNELKNNIASVLGTGMGGGLYLSNVHSATVTSNSFVDNVGSAAGPAGIGGGLFFVQAGGLQVTGNNFKSNSASTSARRGVQGLGGAIYGASSAGVAVAANLMTTNLASLHNNGSGGAVYLYFVLGALLNRNGIAENWAVLYDFNQAQGGGIGLGNTALISVTDNSIVGNVAGLRVADGVLATVMGGGIAGLTVDGMVIAGNVISGNIGALTYDAGGLFQGGGVAIDISAVGDSSNVDISHNVIAGNVVLNSATSCGEGGGVHVAVNGLRVQGNYVLGNRGCLMPLVASQNADGLHIEGNVEDATVTSSDALVDGNAIIGNPAQPPLSHGTGLFIDLTDGFTATNNLIVGNGIGLRIYGGRQLTDTTTGSVINNTIADQMEGIRIDFWNGAPLQLINNIVVSESVGITLGVPGAYELGYNLLHGNSVDIGGGGVITNTHVVTGAPAFVDPATYNFSILPWSAAVDAGDPAGAPPAPAIDIVGTARPRHGHVDIGAYELPLSDAFLPLVRKQ